jgi:hypothetical protein
MVVKAVFGGSRIVFDCKINGEITEKSDALFGLKIIVSLNRQADILSFIDAG